MKKVSITISLIILVTSLVYSLSKQPIKFESKNGLYGYKNSAGKIVIKPVYLVAMNFNQYGIAFVINKKRDWVMINNKGQVIVKMFIFDNGPDYFSEGLARYVHNNKMGFVNKKGKIVILARFPFAYPFINNYARVVKDYKIEKIGEHSAIKGGKWGLINKKGKLVLDYKYDSISDIEDGKVTAYLKGKKIVLKTKNLK